jgi:hypothetical protein
MFYKKGTLGKLKGTVNFTNKCISNETLTTGLMIPSGTNSPPAEVQIQ